MALSGTALTETSTFTANIYPPQANSAVESNDVTAGEQALANRTKYLNDKKLNLTGGTLTGKLTITPSTAVQGLQVTAGAASGQSAIQATGDGVGPAIIGTGGTSGAGASFTAGGGNSFGVRGIGAGTEVGGEFTGSGGGVRAIAATASTGTTPKYSILAVDGGMSMSGVVSPNPTVDPGVNFAQFPQNMITSRVLLSTNPDTILGGFNVASVSGDASGVVTVNFARNLPGNLYAIQVFVPDGYLAGWNGVQNVGNFQFTVRSATTNATVDLTTTSLRISVHTIGF